MAHGFVISRPDGSQRKISGYRYREPHPSAKRYSARGGVQNPPPKVDLRGHLTPVEDQGELSSCVANAVAGAYEYLVKRHRGDDAYDVSRLFIYYNARATESAKVADEGSVIADAIARLRDKGACSEITWPYDPKRVNQKPNDKAYDEAARFLVEDVQLIPTELDAWRSALAEGYPIVFGLSLYDSFDQQKRKGLVPMPSPREASRASHAGHSMLCVGYSDPDRLFIVRNSWGTGWGEKGYCYIPYEYLMNEKYNDGDSWIIRQLENVEVDAATWGDDQSLVGDFHTELGKMSDEDFHAMLEAMGSLHLETRLALLFLCAAGADGDVADEELAGIVEYLSGVLEELGSAYDAEKVLRHALKRADDQRAIDSSITLLGEHLPSTMLASILKSMREIVGTDEVSEDEEDFLARLVEAWQIEESDEEEGDEEEGEEDDEDEDEDDDEGDEDDEDEEDEEEGDEEEDGEEEDEGDEEEDGEEEDEEEDE